METIKIRNRSLWLILGLYLLTMYSISCSAQTGALSNSSNPQLSSNQTPVVSPQGNRAESEPLDTSKWKKYVDKKNGYSFLYPPNLILQKKGSLVRLYHFIKFRNQEPCDNRSNPPLRAKLIDFDITFEIVNKGFESKDWETSGTQVPFEMPKLKRDVAGRSNWYAYDGCGEYEYIYPFKENQSLVIKEQIIGFFSPIAGNEANIKKALQNPALIKNSADIRNRIIESFDYLKR